MIRDSFRSSDFFPRMLPGNSISRLECDRCFKYLKRWQLFEQHVFSYTKLFTIRRILNFHSLYSSVSFSFFLSFFCVFREIRNYPLLVLEFQKGREREKKKKRRRILEEERRTIGGKVPRINTSRWKWRRSIERNSSTGSWQSLRWPRKVGSVIRNTIYSRSFEGSGEPKAAHFEVITRIRRLSRRRRRAASTHLAFFPRAKYTTVSLPPADSIGHNYLSLSLSDNHCNT